MKAVLSLLLLGSILLQAPATVAAEILLHCGSLIDVLDGKVLQEQSVLVRDDRIVSVEPGYRTAEAGQTLVDLREHTVMPGLMDMHTHLTLEMKGSTSYLDRFTLHPADYAYRSADNARKTLQQGFTAVRELGDMPGSAGVSVALRKAIAAGLVEGPRIFTAEKSIATTGGHADPTNGWRPDLMGDPGPAEGTINGPIDARKAVRQRYKNGADLIKLTVTGGVMSLAKSPDNPQFFDDELQAVVKTAREYGMTVAVHAHGAEGMKRAVEAGVDSVEHGTHMDDEVMRLMKKMGTWYVPTISAGRWVADHATSYPAIVQPKAAAIGPQIQDTFARAVKKGIKIAFGTDAGVFPHGLNGREFLYMVEAGMTPLQTIRAATINAATLLHMEQELGSITAGKFADLVAVAGRPDEEIAAMLEVRFVMKAGKVYRQDP